MTKYREILRLKSLGLSQQSIADSCNVSKKTVNRVLKRAKELNISWPLDKSDTDAVLAEMFFPSTKQVRSNKRMPDYDYVHKELLRNGVSKKLLWTEYMEGAIIHHLKMVIAFCRKPLAWSLMISAKVPCFNHPEEATLPLRWLCQLPFCGLAAEERLKAIIPR